MGYRARWLAVKNADLKAVLRTIGLGQESETREPIYDTGFYAANLPGCCLVVIGDWWDHMDAVSLLTRRRSRLALKPFTSIATTRRCARRLVRIDPVRRR
jgi:hypothetical protein